MYEHIYGIVPPMTTPFRADQTIDEPALRAEARYMVETAKVHGLAVGGSAGEGHTLTLEEVRRTTGMVMEEVRGRIPVIAGVITDSTESAIERGRAVKDLGVAALQVTPPHYVFRPDDDAIATQTGVPVLIYNVIPWAYLSPQLLARILTKVDGVIGVKQSAGDMKMLADLLLLIGNRARIMSAVDALLYSSFTLGAHGAIAAILTAVPTLCVKLWDAVRAGDHALALDLHRKILPVWNAIFDDNLPANVKYCMELQGRPAGLPRPPMPATSERQAGPIRQALQNAGLL